MTNKIDNFYYVFFVDLCVILGKRPKGKYATVDKKIYTTKEELIYIIENEYDSLSEQQRNNTKTYVENNNLQDIIKIKW